MKTEKNEVVDLKKRVTIVGTGKSKYMPKGAEFNEHPRLADVLVKSGKATYKK